MPRQLLITLPDDVYEELRRRAGRDDVSGYIERLIRPEKSSDRDLEEGYRAMAGDKEREREALEWIESEPGDALP
ncbi:MAG: addiction module antitoxin [Chloroflexi bacterium]|nr:addiction module antitoxin [Chloroflexota bacterium]